MNKAEVSLKEDAVLVIKNGELRSVPTPDSGFGEQSVLWQDGKIHTIRVSYTEK